uniref:Uncharacterized protein n=1 Tax=Sinocyclocheilus grahami TaxID=75366 RepID=A0A672Q1L4_SINGR
ITSQASRDDVPPIIVKTHMNQQFNDGSKPMIVFAEVSQNYRPVINAEAWATLESETGSVHTLQLLDNGAGADAFQDDGIYSRYFTKIVNGRSSLKVRVKNQGGQTRFAVQKNSGAPYIPGYVVNVNDDKLHFTLSILRRGLHSVFCSVETLELLSLTSIKCTRHKITMQLFFFYYDCNTAAVSPQEAGSDEQHSFNLSFPIQNGSTLFFAVQSEDEQNATSEASNIAQASKILPGPKAPGVSNPGMNLTVIVISVCVVTMVICFIVAVTTWAVRRRNLSV